MNEQIIAEVEKIQDALWQTSEYIHAHPELCFQEYKAQDALCTLLEDHGFQVQRGYAGLETAFRGEFVGQPGGPTIGLLCEYDALAELGHACGHNLIGTISVGAAIAASKLGHVYPGKIVVVGTPAEEGGGGKVLILDAGGMDDLDCAMIIHPTDLTMVDDYSLANTAYRFQFAGKSAHAAAYPQEGVNALEGVIQTFNLINALRQHQLDDVRIHGIITDGGVATNIVPDYAACAFSIRAGTRKVLNEVLPKVINCANGAALATGTTLTVVKAEGPDYDEIMNNGVLKNILHDSFNALGEPVHPRLKEKGMGSTDMGNVTQHLPGFQAYIGLGEGAVTHTPRFTEMTTGETGRRALMVATKALAMTTLTLLAKPELVAQAKAEFQQAKEAQA